MGLSAAINAFFYAFRSGRKRLWIGYLLDVNGGHNDSK